MLHSQTESSRIEVPKNWGREEWLVNNELYCAKYLFVQPGWQCSLHRHAIKDETFIVEYGFIHLEFDGKKRYLKPGDSQRIVPGTWHRFSNEESVAVARILEV
jgi:mannose-6-phosphate isomerase-like protein (cupin superfamily)